MKKYTKKQIDDHRRLWINALRSGKYKKAKGKLSDGNDFCCLGVACDLYSHVDPNLNIRTSPFSVFYDEQKYTLPERVSNWLGIKSGSIQIPSSIMKQYKKGESDITVVNDAMSFSFNRIADILEKYFELENKK